MKNISLYARTEEPPSLLCLEEYFSIDFPSWVSNFLASGKISKSRYNDVILFKFSVASSKKILTPKDNVRCTLKRLTKIAGYFSQIESFIIIYRLK